MTFLQKLFKIKMRQAKKPPCIQPRGGHVAGSTGSGYIIVAGGYSTIRSVAVSSAEILSKFGRENVQEKLPNMNEPRMYAAAAILGQSDAIFFHFVCARSSEPRFYVHNCTFPYCVLRFAALLHEPVEGSLSLHRSFFHLTQKPRRHL